MGGARGPVPRRGGRGPSAIGAVAAAVGGGPGGPIPGPGGRGGAAGAGALSPGDHRGDAGTPPAIGLLAFPDGTAAGLG